MPVFAPITTARCAAGLALCIAFSATLSAEVRCPAIFGDHMVLQRGKTVPVWGEAQPGESVSVEFADEVKTTKADDQGRWRVSLSALTASTEPRALIVRGENALTFSDVLVGDVWFCSGQSNMEKPFGPRKGQQPTEHSDGEFAAADRPNLRLFQVPHSGVAGNKPAVLQWVRSTPASLRDSQFSAAGYVFGRELLAALKDVPIGLIHSSFGGTQIEAWLPPEAFAETPELKGVEKTEIPAWVKGVQATELYTSMVKPFTPYALRGFLWYQGEANCMMADCGPSYTTKLRALVGFWRKAWGDDDLPFYYALIAPFDYSTRQKFPKPLTPEALPAFWEAQIAALDVPKTGLIVTTDLVANVRDIHPVDKRDVGIRFAKLALAETYGRNDVVAHGPRFDKASADNTGRLVLAFSHAEGLHSRDGKPLTEFSIADEDRVFHPAAAVVEGKTVIVSSPEVPHPVAARFAWRETALPNLENGAGLPAVPFRTDNWPVALLREKKN
ncbi:sialate O-acetylesterase [Opitutaceae bacterium EW11]|nr:sialate O-acetylesterase [Opitutaceae bacterium EW11]